MNLTISPSSKTEEFSTPSVTQKKAVHPLTKIACGALVAATELLTLGHVFDRIKTNQQAYPGKFTAWESAKNIHQLKGFSGFYTGIRWNLFTHCSKSAFRWAVMDNVISLWNSIIPKKINTKYPTLQMVLTGISMSVVEAVCIVCPAESLKTKEMTQRFKSYKFIPYMSQLGWRRLYDGLDVVILRQSLSWVSFLVTYEKARQLAVKLNDGNTKLNLPQLIGVSTVTGTFNVVLTTPLDTVKTLVQKDTPLNYKTILENLNFKQPNGCRKLYSGLGVRILRSTWYSFLTLSLMERLNIFNSNHA